MKIQKGSIVEVKTSTLGLCVGDVLSVNEREDTVTVSLLGSQPDGRQIGHFEQRRICNKESVKISVHGMIFLAMKRRERRRET